MDTSISSSNTTSGIGRLILILLGIFAVIFILFFLIRGVVRSVRSVFAPTQTTAKTATANTDVALVQTPEEIIVTNTLPLDETPHTIDEILAEPESFIGQKVIVNGYIDRKEDPWGFFLKEDGVLMGEMLIITYPTLVNQDIKDFQVPTAEEQQPASISGTVKRLTHEQSDEFGLDRDDLRDIMFSEQLVIVPDEIKKL